VICVIPIASLLRPFTPVHPLHHDSVPFFVSSGGTDASWPPAEEALATSAAALQKSRRSSRENRPTASLMAEAKEAAEFSPMCIPVGEGQKGCQCPIRPPAQGPTACVCQRNFAQDAQPSGNCARTERSDPNDSSAVFCSACPCHRPRHSNG